MDDRKPLIPLITTLREQKKSQRALAEEVGIPESIMSLTVNGKFILDSATKLKIANILNKPVSELF